MVRRYIPIVLGLLLIFSIGGVFATWKYAGAPIGTVRCEMDVRIEEFEFRPEEILPGGDDQEAPIGGNHLALIELILNESDKGYGLNINDNVLLHSYLRDQPVVYSNQKISGGNLKFILDPTNNTHGLYYCVEKVSDTEYYAYTFSVEELEEAGPPAAEIEVYRTILVKTDIWRATTSYQGYATVKPLRHFGVSASSHSVEYSIDVEMWHQ